jgi:FKBP-type peptidyl-prolyl cis-trans isomerase
MQGIIQNATGLKKANSHKTVPWWMEELTIMRKRMNALRRRYQRTRNNTDLREQRRSQYLEGKARFSATKKRKNNFMAKVLQHGVLYQSTKRGKITQITALRKTKRILTAYIRETLKHMLEYFTPKERNLCY